MVAVFTVEADGSDPVNLTGWLTFPWLDLHRTAWSPDGSRLLACSDRDGDEEIYTIRPDDRSHRSSWPGGGPRD